MESHFTKGISRLSVIPVRSEPTDAAEQVTQLLFGDHYEVLETSENKKWYQIRIQFDGYVGWIDNKQHTEISEAYFEQINLSNYRISLDVITSILFRKQPLFIVKGSVLPISTSELFKMEEQLAFNGESKSLGQRMNVEFLMTTAKSYLNSPYSWGGRSPFGIDCSGFTQIVYKICGYKLQRDASEQAKQGDPVEITGIMPGDLAFFANPEGRITHVGICMEDGQIIHASGRVRTDMLDSKGIKIEETGQYSHKYAFTRRIIKN